MGTISAEKLLNQWKVEDLTVERAIGQMLQHLVQLHETSNNPCPLCKTLQPTIEGHTSTLTNLRADVDGLIAHTNMPPRRRKKRSR